MQRHHSGYDNIVTWKTVRTGDSLAVVPAPGLAWWNAVVCVPFFAVALWFLHFQLEIASRAGLLLADAIIVGTQGLLFVLCWRARSRARADSRPFVEVSRSGRTVRFPRAEVELPLDSAGYFVAHDFFSHGCEFAVSELNCVRESAGGGSSPSRCCMRWDGSPGSTASAGNWPSGAFRFSFAGSRCKLADAGGTRF